MPFVPAARAPVPPVLDPIAIAARPVASGPRVVFVPVPMLITPALVVA